MRAVLKFPLTAGQDPAINILQAFPEKTVIGGIIGGCPVIVNGKVLLADPGLLKFIYKNDSKAKFPYKLLLTSCNIHFDNI